MATTLGPYPEYGGSPNVTGMASFRAARTMGNNRQFILMNWIMQGLDMEGCAGAPPAGVANACGIHIHEGMTCEDIQGDYYDADYWAPEDPWSNVNYTTNGSWPTSNAKTGGNNYKAVVTTGFNYSSIAGRALVVYDSTGVGIACGLIEAASENFLWLYGKPPCLANETGCGYWQWTIR